MSVLYSIALDKEINPVNIKDATKDATYYCCSKNCNSEMIPKQGVKYQWHYAHKSNEIGSCKETYIHFLGKECIKELGYIVVNDSNLSNSEIRIDLHNIELEKGYSGFRPDVQAEIKDHSIFGNCKVWIEVVNTSKPSKSKIDFMKNKDDLIVIRFGVGYSEAKDLIENIKIGKNLSIFETKYRNKLYAKKIFSKLEFVCKTNPLVSNSNLKAFVLFSNIDILNENINNTVKLIDNINLFQSKVVMYNLHVNNFNDRLCKDLFLDILHINQFKDYFFKPKNEIEKELGYFGLNPSILDYTYSYIENKYSSFKQKINEKKQQRVSYLKNENKKQIDSIKWNFQSRNFKTLKLISSANKSDFLNSKECLKGLIYSLERITNLITYKENRGTSNPQSIKYYDTIMNYLGILNGLSKYYNNIESDSEIENFEYIYLSHISLTNFKEEYSKEYLFLKREFEKIPNNNPIINKSNDTNSSQKIEDGIEIRIEISNVPNRTKEYILSTQDAYWKWNLYQLPLNDFQISRNFHRAKEFYKGHVDLMQQWKKDFIHNTKLDKKQILFFERLA